MRGVVVGRLSFLSISAAALFAASGLAIAQQQKPPANCFDRDIAITAAHMGCRGMAGGATVTNGQAANAFYNSARAYLSQNNYYEAAVDIASSRARLADSALNVVMPNKPPPKKDKEAIESDQRFFVGRAYHRAEALEKLADAGPPLNQQSPATCSSKDDCLVSVTKELSAVQNTARFLVPKGTDVIRYDDFLYKRATAYTTLRQTAEAKRDLDELARIPGTNHQADANGQLVLIYLQEGDDSLAQPGPSTVSAARARDSYNAALNIDRNNLKAKVGLGKVSLLEARLPGLGAAQRQAKYAEAASALNGLASADAYEARGEALLEQSKLEGVNVDSAALRTAALAEFERAAGSTTAAEPQLTRARVLADIGNFDIATTAYDDALVRLGASDPKAPAVRIERNLVAGKAAFLKSPPNYNVASKSFGDVISAAGMNGNTAAAEAYYYLSLIDTRAPSSSADSIVSNAKQAVDLDGGKMAYRYQDCLARLKNGKAAALAIADASCASSDLLQGMLSMKRGQSAPIVSKVQLMNAASGIFMRGAAALPAATDAKFFQWPGSSGLPLKDLFETGRVLSLTCASGTPNTYLSEQRFNELRDSFFGFYNVRCS